VAKYLDELMEQNTKWLILKVEYHEFVFRQFQGLVLGIHETIHMRIFGVGITWDLLAVNNPFVIDVVTSDTKVAKIFLAALPYVKRK